jgi:hypothetical protein
MNTKWGEESQVVGGWCEWKNKGRMGEQTGRSLRAGISSCRNGNNAARIHVSQQYDAHTCEAKYATRITQLASARYNNIRAAAILILSREQNTNVVFAQRADMKEQTAVVWHIAQLVVVSKGIQSSIFAAESYGKKSAHCIKNMI